MPFNSTLVGSSFSRVHDCTTCFAFDIQYIIQFSFSRIHECRCYQILNIINFIPINLFYVPSICLFNEHITSWDVVKHVFTFWTSVCTFIASSETHFNWTRISFIKSFDAEGSEICSFLLFWEEDVDWSPCILTLHVDSCAAWSFDFSSWWTWEDDSCVVWSFSSWRSLDDSCAAWSLSLLTIRRWFLCGN